MFSIEGLGYANLLAVLTILGGGAVFNAFESDQHLSAWQGVYWAIATMKALGSDIYPQSTGGQATAVVLVLVGIRFVALLPGAIAQRFLNPDTPQTPADAAVQGIESPGSVF